MAKASKVTPCPCGSGREYRACCGRFIEGGQAAPSAVELMRSRYTAHALRDAAYLQRTWHPGKRTELPPGQDARNLKWLSLDVLRDACDGAQATVEFVARYKLGGRAQRMHEVSRFVREDGQWYYLDGDDPEQTSNPAQTGEAGRDSSTTQ